MKDNTQQLSGGFLVMFEGMDGTGKTTQLQLAEQKLQHGNYSVTTKRTPGGTPIGEALRGVLLDSTPRPPMTDLYIALAIQEPLNEAIDVERQQGATILLDRGPLSIAAYQIYGSGIDEATGWRYVDEHMKHLQPDLVIVYDCEPQEALARARQKSAHSDYFENMPDSYFERVSNGYQAAAQRYSSVVIDASQSIEAIHTQTMQYIEQALAKKASSGA
jgi:dTMP kinase